MQINWITGLTTFNILFKMYFTFEQIGNDKHNQTLALISLCLNVQNHPPIPSAQDCHPVRCLSFHPTGDYMAVGTDHEVIRIYDLHTAQSFVSAIPSQQHTGGVSAIKYSACAKIYASGSSDGSIKLWDAVSGRCINTFAQAHDNAEVCSVFFSRNGKVGVLSRNRRDRQRLVKTEMGCSANTLVLL